MKLELIGSELKKILIDDPGAIYRLRYIDYEDGFWTLPVLLKNYRIDKFANDNSLDKVEVKLSNGEIILFKND